MQPGRGDETHFLPYEIRAPLGSGGMGEVYRAWDPRLRREVALKVLHERGAADPDRVRRFVAEARAASALNHPNILTVFDASVEVDAPYIVAELIEGDSLREELRKGAVPVKRLLDLATQIADGLAEAHAAHIVHRDLKPENIMITRAGRVKIVDFGLAAAVSPVAGHVPQAAAAETLTEPSLLVGTVPYMSPEQASGLAGDFRSDQFSLGLILYEMATGQAPFRRDTPAATLDAIIHDEPVPLATRAPRLPFVLAWIVERCLAKNPADRYGATADLHRDLRTLRDRLAEASRHEDSASPDRPRASAWKVATVLLTLGAVATGVAAWRIAGAARRAAETQPSFDLGNLTFRAIATAAAYEGLPALSPDGQQVAYSQDVNGVLQIFTRRLESSDTAVPVTKCTYDCKYPFWSPDSKRLYYVSLARTTDGLWSIGASGGSQRLVVEDVTRAAISPDGRTLAFLRDEQRADTIGTASLWLSTPEGTAPWSNAAVQQAAQRYAPLGDARFIDAALAFSPDGTRLALCGVPGIREDRMWHFWLIPLAGEQPPQRRLQWWSDAGPRKPSLSWFPDGRHVALGMSSLSTPGSHLWIVDVQNDQAWPFTRGADSESYPSVSPTGDRIVFTRGEPDYDLLSIPLTPGASPQSLLASPQSESDPTLRPDGKMLAYVTDRSGQDEIWRRSLDGSVEAPLITQRDFGDDRTVMLSSPAYSPDGSRLAYQRNGFKPRWPLRIWISMLDGGVAAPLLPVTYDGIQSAPSWSPDGAWIAFAQWRGKSWELAKVRYGSGEVPEILRQDGVANASPHWSPRGRTEWITWETARGLVLVSPDGKAEKRLSTEQWLVHTWSEDGREIYAIRETDDFKLVAVALSVETGKERVLAEVGRSFAFNNPVKGLTLLPGGHALATSVIRPRGDLWIAEGIAWKKP